ncbi:glycosyltransferase [Methanomassiliicoccaceae archaeon COG_1]|nr:glycosyltransferase [Methanomassiliicoccaceae archaeon COG_1]
MAKVSIVVPVYNVQEYLEECLDSIRAQTLEDIEVICVDDGSTDKSLKIIKRYAREDPRFIYITKPNAGYGDSMNRGFDKASGEYVGIVESDDYVEPDMFETLYNAAKANGCEVVKSDYFEFTTKNKDNQNYINTVIKPEFYNRAINHEMTLDIYHFKMNTWTGIYLNEFIRASKIRHNVTPGAAYQDNGFWFQTLSLAKRVYFVDRAFYHYRQDNPNSSINSKSKVFCMCDEYKYIEAFLDSHPELHDQLYMIFLVKKYFNYIYTYHRVAEEYKIPFLRRFADEFREPMENGTFTRENLGGNVYQIIYRIVKSPETFYYEDTIWALQHNSIPIAQEIDRIHANRYYKPLHKMRLI